MKIIEKMFNGQIYPYESMTDSAKYREANARLEGYLTDIEEKLSDNSIKGKIRGELVKMEYESIYHAFEIGFSLGTRLTSECFHNNQ